MDARNWGPFGEKKVWPLYINIEITTYVFILLFLFYFFGPKSVMDLYLSLASDGAPQHRAMLVNIFIYKNGKRTM